MTKKTKLVLEYPFRCSKSFLYKYISNPGGLAEWFADDVQYKNNHYYFIWDDEEPQVAVLSDSRLNVYCRYRWDHATHETEFLEFRLLEEELTRETILQVTDFCMPEDEKETRMLWDNTIKGLREIIGA